MYSEQERESLGRAVAQARVDAGWSKETAAKRAGISSITWKRVEDGLGVQDVKLRAIAQALGWDDTSLARATEGAVPYFAGRGRSPDTTPEPTADPYPDLPLFSEGIDAGARGRRQRAFRLDPGEVVEHATRLRNFVVHGGDDGVEPALDTAIDLLASLSVLVEQLEIINHWIEERDNELEVTTEQDAPSAAPDQKTRADNVSTLIPSDPAPPLDSDRLAASHGEVGDPDIPAPGEGSQLDTDEDDEPR